MTGEIALSALPKLNFDSIINQPVVMVALLIGITLLPLVGILATSFVKIAVVFSIARQAIGLQQSPPNVVITSLSLILTAYVMAPVATKVMDAIRPELSDKHAVLFDSPDFDQLSDIALKAKPPIAAFLKKHASKKNLALFTSLRSRVTKEPLNEQDSLIVLLPAFVITVLTKAFQIGFMVFLPFLVVDMVVANILMALGMQMLAPTIISLPFKLLLFVVVDGWHLIAKSLVLSYS